MDILKTSTLQLIAGILLKKIKKVSFETTEEMDAFWALDYFLKQHPSLLKDITNYNGSYIEIKHTFSIMCKTKENLLYHTLIFKLL